MRFVLPLLLVIAALPAQSAEVYRCMTENGVVRYSDMPCADGRSKKLDIENQSTDETAVAERARQRKQEIAELDKAETAAREAEQKTQQEAEKRGQACTAARERQRKLETARRVTTGEGEEKRFLESAEIEQRRKEAAQKVAELCRD